MKLRTTINGQFIVAWLTAMVIVAAVMFESCHGGASESSMTGELKKCRDRYPFCPSYAEEGHCELNAGWMTLNCPISCDACHLLDPAVRCSRQHLNMSDTPAFLPGDLNAMFESLVEQYDALYNVTIVSTAPWIVTFDNFLSDAEADALVARQGNNWKRSVETGAANAAGETGRSLNAGRTSSNSWCFGDCQNDPNVARVISRIETVSRLNVEHHEFLQVLKYEPGQKYTTHHDHAVADSTRPAGARALTFFLYLSDVEEGGETNFPSLDIFIQPKKGKAVLWPNTLDSDPATSMDERTYHQALPVIKGTKYAANSWIHAYPYQKANMWGCTGTMG